MIKNIVFDIGRVLVGFEWMDYVRSMFDEETAEAVTRAMWAPGRWEELDRGILSEEEILNRVYQADTDHREEIFRAYDRVGECVTRLDYAIPWIKSLKDRGLGIYYLSNYSEHLMRQTPEALDFLAFMDGGVFSCFAKAIKPEENIYLTLFETFGLDPKDCLFIDDRPENVQAAADLGMEGIRFESYEQARRDVEHRLDREHGEGGGTADAPGGTGSETDAPGGADGEPAGDADRFNISPMTRGYIQIYTGGGKGKTTAAMGLAMRAAGAGLRVFIGEFIKDMEYGEVRMLRERFPEVAVELFGIDAGCIIDRRPTEEDRKAAEAGLASARKAMLSGDWDLVILDEATIPVSLELLAEEDLLEFMDEKPDGVELIITGRGATEAMKEKADLVSEMKEIKHYYRKGVLSRRGIEC